MITDENLEEALRAFHGEASTRRDVEAAVRRVLSTAIEETPQQRTWLPGFPAPSLRPLVGAARLVAAGVIVGLLGGFVLAGVLTQPSDEPAPAAVSPSPTGSFELLPGVDLVTEDVRPGVVRVLGAGEHDLSENVRDVAITRDGDVWVEQRMDASDHRVFRIGGAGVSVRSSEDLWFETRTDGTIVLQGSDGTQRVLDGDTWVTPARDQPVCVAASGVLTSDGTCWDLVADGSRGLQRIDASGEARTFSPEEIGLSSNGAHVHHIAEAEDGTIWVDIFDSGAAASEGSAPSDVLETFRGLAAYDGRRWTTVEYEASDPEPAGFFAVDLAVGPDGIVWVTFERPGAVDPTKLVVRSWDGSTWDTYGPLETAVGVYTSGDYGPEGTRFRPAGEIWLGRMAAIFDGDRLRKVEPRPPTAGRLPAVDSIAYMPDGSAWVVVADDLMGEQVGLYVIRPEAAAGT